MKTEILYRPSYSMAKISLSPGEKIISESGAMAGMSADMLVDTQMKGGFLKSFARTVLTGESFFMNTYVAGSMGGEIWLSPALPGDVFTLEIHEAAYLVQSGSFMASDETITTDTKWGGARTFFGGEGLIMLRCSGTGTLILSSYGAIHELDLTEGEQFTIDTGHLVAFSENIGFRVRTIGGLKSTLLGGEGLVVDLTGPGKVLMQTRSMGAFLDWLIPRLPKPSETHK